jgi:hypothetical protein
MSEINSLTERIRKQEGKFGNINSVVLDIKKKLDEMDARPAVKQEEPPVSQVSENMKLLEDEFPEYATVIKEVENNLRNEFLSRPVEDSAESVPSIENSLIEKEEEIQRKVLTSIKPDWQAKVGTDHFNGWLAIQDQAVQVKAGSSEAVDVIQVLDTYDEFVNNERQKLKKQEELTSRLKDNIPATKSSSASDLDTDTSGEQEFLKAFKN